MGSLTWACLLYPTLSQHDRNPSEAVKQKIVELQEILEEEELLKKKPDGCFDKETERAVKLFQRIYGLRADGIVGAWTWTILYECDRRLIKLLKEFAISRCTSICFRGNRF